MTLPGRYVRLTDEDKEWNTAAGNNSLKKASDSGESATRQPIRLSPDAERL